MTVEPRSVTAFIGPSGCGKSTFLRTLNRMHEVIPGAPRRGHGAARRRGPLRAGRRPGRRCAAPIGMVFQRPNPFPTMSIYDNVAAGLKLQRRDAARRRSTRSSSSRCTGANLWNEVKDRLDKPGAGLSGGQQQRLCIARAIAVEPAGAADGRAVLGARPDLDAGDRGPDRRAEDRLHDRHRHAQHAAGGPGLRPDGVLQPRRRPASPAG